MTPPLLPATVTMMSMTKVYVGGVGCNDGRTASSSNDNCVAFDVVEDENAIIKHNHSDGQQQPMTQQSAFARPPGGFRRDCLTRYDRPLNSDTCPGAQSRSPTSRGGRGWACWNPKR